MILILFFIIFAWDPVTTNTDSSPTKIAYYAIYIRKSGEEWKTKPTAIRAGTRCTISKPPPKPYEVAVTAVNYLGIESLKTTKEIINH